MTAPPHITINGHRLSASQVHAVQVALEYLHRDLVNTTTQGVVLSQQRWQQLSQDMHAIQRLLAGEAPQGREEG